MTREEANRWADAGGLIGEPLTGWNPKPVEPKLTPEEYTARDRVFKTEDGNPEEHWTIKNPPHPEYTCKSKFWPFFKIYKKKGHIWESGCSAWDVDETVIEIKMPWKAVIYSPYDDHYVKRHPTWTLIWHKVPVSKSGYKARWGWI